MKIMHLIDSGGFYGAEVMLLNLMVAQKKLGLEPVLYSMGKPGNGEKEIERRARQQGIEVIVVRMGAGLNPYGTYQILLTAKAKSIDILHSHGYKGNILAGLIPKFVRKLPLICTVHGWTNTSPMSKLALYEWLDRRLQCYKDAVVAVNKLLLEDTRLTTAKISADRLFVVNNGIDPDPEVGNAADTEEHLRIRDFTREGFIIGAIGRLSREKAYAHLLEATALLHNDGHNVRLVLVGDGPLYDELNQKAAALGIADIVLFAGYLANASQFLRYFNVLAISSLSEGLPITLLEAMRARIPVVSTRVGGIADVISDGKSGLLVPPANVQALSSALSRMICEPAIRDTFSRQAGLDLKQHYSSDKMAGNYLDIYKIITCPESA
jgi:glycosyltransferase involved in cell wall biosynthesis